MVKFNSNVRQHMPRRGVAQFHPSGRRSGALPAAQQSSTTAIRKRMPYDFSVTGFIYVCMMAFIILAAINSQANLLFGVFGLMVGILLISFVVCRLVLSRVKVERILPEYAAVGESAAIQYRFTNGKRFWPSMSISLAEMDGVEAFVIQPQAYLLHAAPGMTGNVPIELFPKRRGQYLLDTYQISTSFPFGFVKRALDRRRRDAVTIFPALGEVSRQLLNLCRAAESTTATMKPRRGGQDEFFGVKEFRTGENPRWIHWKRSARTGELVVKEMTRVSPPRLLILVDTFLGDRSVAEHSAVERAIAMAASLANTALESGMAVGLCAWSNEWLYSPAQRGKRHCRDILAILANLPINQTHPLDQLLDQGNSQIKSGITAVLFTPRNVQLGLTDHVRGDTVVVPSMSQQARRWFHFHENIRFDLCMPPDQQPEIREEKKNGDNGFGKWQWLLSWGRKKVSS